MNQLQARQLITEDAKLKQEGLQWTLGKHVKPGTQKIISSTMPVISYLILKEQAVNTIIVEIQIILVIFGAISRKTKKLQVVTKRK